MKRKQKLGKTVIVENDNLEKAIRKLRRLMTQNNIMKDYYQHLYYIKPSIKNKKKKSLRKWKANLWLEQFKKRTNT